MQGLCKILLTLGENVCDVFVKNRTKHLFLHKTCIVTVRSLRDCCAVRAKTTGGLLYQGGGRLAIPGAGPLRKTTNISVSKTPVGAQGWKGRG